MKKIGSFAISASIVGKTQFLQFCADLSKNLKSVKAITYMRLKVLITLFQKMVWFIGVWEAFHEILAIKISKKML